jgi:sulfoxide reductase heme-binding subunit YedZ
LKEFKFSSVLVFVNSLVPLALLGWDAYHHRLGANPLEFVTRATGTMTLIFLLFTLAVTPLRKLTKWNWLGRQRRQLGLFAFFYGALHFLTYVWFDKFFNLRLIGADLVQRYFIIVGMLSFFLMIPLAVTSTNAMIRRLGGKRWNRLHKLVYVTAIGGVLHSYLLVKADTTKPLLYGAAFAILLGYRLIVAYLPPATKTTKRVPVAERQL